MKHDVFISHAHEDKSIADAICEKLESADLKCWRAPRDIPGREDWTEATRKAIGSSRLIVLVLSENANAAPHIEREIARSFYMRRIIISFRLAETLPRREILSYLGNVPWVNALNPPTEEHLQALTSRIKGLIDGSADAGNATPPQGERKKIASQSPSHSWIGGLRASHYRTLGILKWVGITTFICAAVLFLWFALRQTKEWASLAESHRRSVDRDFSLSPTPLPQAESVTPFGLWQAANSSPTPLVQGRQHLPLNTPAERSTNATSPSQRDVTPGERAAGLASEPRPRHLSPVTHRVSHDYHQQYPETQGKEARKIADLKNQRDSLQNQLKATEAKVLATQKNADIVARELDELRDQLKETENKALTAQKNEELLRTQRDALQTRLEEAESEAQAAQKNADLATRQRDALQNEIGKLSERAQLAEAKANLATSHRDTMEAELKKKEEEEAQANQRGADHAELPNSAPETQFQEVPKDAQPAHEDAEFAQTQPPNPGQKAKPAPLTQTLESTGPVKELTQ